MRSHVDRSQRRPATPGEVFSLIRDGRALTRSDVGRLTGLSRTAVAARLGALLGSGLVVEGADDRDRAPLDRRTARRWQLRFNRDAGVVLAGAIGRSRTQLGVCDLDGTVLASVDLDQEVGPAADDLMPQVVAASGPCSTRSGARPDDVRAVGLSIPGTVDFARGASLDSPIMAGWDGVELAPFLRPLTRPGLRRQRRQRDGAVRAARPPRAAPRPALREGVDRHRRRHRVRRPGAARGLGCGRRDRAHQDRLGRGAALPLRGHRLRRGGGRRLGAGPGRPGARPRGRPHPRPGPARRRRRPGRPAPGPRGRPPDRRGAGLGGEPAQPRGRRRRRRPGPGLRHVRGRAAGVGLLPGLRARHPRAA